MTKQMNIPNALSILRLFTIPVIFLLILNSTRANYPYLIAVFFISFWLDFFDGYLARKLNQETELGKILDPVADKMLIFALILAMIIASDFPIWLGIVVLARDLVILAGSLLLLRGRKVVAPSLLIGKITFTVLGALLLVYIIDLHPAMNLPLAKHVFIVMSLAYLAWSMAEYYPIYKQLKKVES